MPMHRMEVQHYIYHRGVDEEEDADSSHFSIVASARRRCAASLLDSPEC